MRVPGPAATTWRSRSGPRLCDPPDLFPRPTRVSRTTTPPPAPTWVSASDMRRTQRLGGVQTASLQVYPYALSAQVWPGPHGAPVSVRLLPTTGTFHAAGCVSSRAGAFDAVGDSNPVPERVTCPRPRGNVPARAGCPRPRHLSVGPPWHPEPLVRQLHRRRRPTTSSGPPTGARSGQVGEGTTGSRGRGSQPWGESARPSSVGVAHPYPSNPARSARTARCTRLRAPTRS